MNHESDYILEWDRCLASGAMGENIRKAMVGRKMGIRYLLTLHPQMKAIRYQWWAAAIYIPMRHQWYGLSHADTISAMKDDALRRDYQWRIPNDVGRLDYHGFTGYEVEMRNVLNMKVGDSLWSIDWFFNEMEDHPQFGGTYKNLVWVMNFVGEAITRLRAVMKDIEDPTI